MPAVKLSSQKMFNTAGNHIQLCIFLLASPLWADDPVSKTRLLPVAEYQEKVYASWLGQTVGNIYGLGYEFKFINEPGPDAMPYGYASNQLARVRQLNGSFSDDDTDIEYMYLLQMERHGIEPTYRQLGEAWKYHVRDKIWVANRVALGLMNAGYYPPLTGSREFNDQWFQIDPQLVNEIWAVTAPGMIDYAVAKSDWAARIVSDDFGVEPTVFYAAMYAAAFFEKDVDRLVEHGLQALPPQGRFTRAVRYARELARENPDDWRAARRALAARYYGEFDYNRGAWPAVDAHLNGACAVLALLYGGGNFQRTLDLACAIGFDCDNQAATLGGFLGIANGLKAIPQNLLYPLADARWKQPFNDRYINVTRHDLPDARLSDQARRMALQGEQIILAHGGARLKVAGRECYRINAQARFIPPFELNPPPVLRGALGETLRHPFPVSRPASEICWKLEGHLPDGVKFENGLLAGVPTETGKFLLNVSAWSGDVVRRAKVTLVIHGTNLALTAVEILFNPDARDLDLAMLRDGDRRQRTYFSISSHSQPKADYYGYRWAKPQSISSLRYSVGRLQEWGGWFTSLNVEWLSETGQWLPVRGLRISPALNFDNSQWRKGNNLDYAIDFALVKTRAIRILGAAGGIEPDAANQHAGTHFYTAISELSAYEN